MKKISKTITSAPFIKQCMGLFDSKKSVAVLRFQGVISSQGGINKQSLNLESMKSEIDKAFSLPNLAAVAIAVNSPGGSPVQSELIYNYLRATAEKKSIPIYAFAEDVAASGGYWLLCAGDRMYASGSSIVGSIGVISSGFGFVNVLKKVGVERRIITHGKSKSIYDSFLPVKSSDEKIISAAQKDIHDAFQDMVTSRRGSKIKIDKERLFSGEFWSGKTGVKFGLVDGLGDLYSVMKQEFGEDITFQHIKKSPSWLKKKMNMAMSYENLLDTLLSKIEQKIHYNRFGL